MEATDAGRTREGSHLNFPIRRPHEQAAAGSPRSEGSDPAVWGTLHAWPTLQNPLPTG
jgi:hypothetical protein